MELFKPNNLSTVKPCYERVTDSDVRDSVYSAISFFLPVDKSEDMDISQLVEFGSFAMKFRVRLNNKYYFLKCRYLGEDHGLLLDEATKAVFFSQHNVLVPKLIFAKNGEYAVEVCGRYWILYNFIEGNHFTGIGSELDNAANGFGHLSLVAHGFARVSENEIVQNTFDYNQLSSLLKDSSKNDLKDRTLSSLLLMYRKIIEEHLDKVVRERKIVETEYRFTHADYHPANLLMKDGKLVCILDFEDMKVYPLLSALGFGAYKLIRQMLVNVKPEEVHILSPRLVNRWLDGWHKHFPHADVTADQLALGAKYRVLESIRVILYNYLLLGNSTYNYDLAKQIGSLFEIDNIFDGRFIL